MAKKSYSETIRRELSKIEYDQGILTNVGEHLPRFSSGCLVNDLIIGGGIPPAMITWSGHEGGGKTTLLNHSLAQAVNTGVKTVIHFDAENARDPEYVQQIFHQYNFDEIYGIPGKKAGTWLTPPLINYYPYSQFERVFGTFRAILNVFPDKIYRKEDKTWYYIFRNKKAELARLKEMGLTPDKHLSDRKRYWCPTDDKGIQAVLAVDSWVALVLEDQEEEENDKTGIAAEAREFPKRLRQMKGRLARKQVTLLGVNQLRTNPMAGTYGNPDYEPGGSALKFWSDIRNGMRPVVPKEGFIRDKEARGLAVEKSISGKGNDYYAFKNITNIKNKYGRPLLKGQMRIWVSDNKGYAHGIDPVYDLYQYLSMTGQIDGSVKRGMQIKLGNLKDTKFDWQEFKKLVLFEHFGKKKDLRQLLQEKGIKKEAQLKKLCLKQLQDGSAIDLFQNSLVDTKEPDYPDLESSD